jgi:sugar lactone lactonase YvrE
LAVGSAIGILLGVDACAGAGSVRLETATPPGEALVWPAPPDPPRIRFVSSFSGPRDLGFRRSLLSRFVSFIRGGSNDDSLQHPHGIAVGDDETVYVVDSSARGVHVFDLPRGRHRFLTHDALRQPIGVAVTPQRSIYVSDPVAGFVLHLDEDGKELARLEGALVRPTGLAFDAERTLLYVVDTERHAVTSFDESGALLSAFGGRGTEEGSFNYPTNIAIDREGWVYVTDSMNFRVQVFDPEGAHLMTFGRLGDGPGAFARPKGIGVDGGGRVFVVEGLYDVVNTFDAAGRLLLSFGGAGTEVGNFWLATGLAVDRRNRIFVADTYNNRIQVFQLMEEAGL